MREAGAVPATIAVLEGKLVAGLSSQQLAYLAEADGVAKVSRADLASVLASGRPGATTVAGSVYSSLPGQASASSPQVASEVSIEAGKRLRHLRRSCRTRSHSSRCGLRRREGCS